MPSEGRVDGDPCYMYNYFIISRSIRSWLMNLPNLLAPHGCKRPASPTSANNGVPAVFHNVRADIVRRDNRFRAGLIGVVDIRKALCSEAGIVYSPGAGGFTNPSQSGIGQWGWDFHNVRGGINPGDHRFRLRFVGVVDVWKDL